jgi:hypothetical protein
MDTDFWGGIVICAGGCAIGAFLLWGLATAPRRLRPRGKSVTRSGRVMTIGIAAAFIGVGILMLFVLTLAPRLERTLTVSQKYYLSGGTRTPGHYEVVTDRGSYEATDQDLYDGLRVGRAYRCSVRSTGYTGPYSAFKDQSTLESCHPASGG